MRTCATHKHGRIRNQDIHSPPSIYRGLDDLLSHLNLAHIARNNYDFRSLDLSLDLGSLSVELGRATAVDHKASASTSVHECCGEADATRASRDDHDLTFVDLRSESRLGIDKWIDA